MTDDNWFDVLLLCIPCHTEYEQQALDLRHRIAEEHGIPQSGVEPAVDSDVFRIVKYASALKRHWCTSTEPRRQVRQALLRRDLGSVDINANLMLWSSDL